ncbi:PaaI family thioesterase [Maritimibacter sp. UBA3975]|uniref:PaaI family thioesterase n=1 Tax=Maritimibacter sp. UBA3975 TaxID=1946833 RepID=UPI000C096CF7|nr:PaaI family thioesterase [Maritimibacter sp. UBA3975]MAM62509.1 phenylacetic acid degradation protein [Maritimibacter sp.]
MTTFTPKDPAFEARVRASFARQPMMETLGATLTSVAPGVVDVTSTIPPGTLQQQGQTHAGLAFSIGDTAAGYAASTLLPPNNEVVTSEMKIHLLAPGRGDRLVATGRVIRPGRRLTIVEADVWAETGTTRTLIAKLMGTMVPVPLTETPT